MKRRWLKGVIWKLLAETLCSIAGLTLKGRSSWCGDVYRFSSSSIIVGFDSGLSFWTICRWTWNTWERLLPNNITWHRCPTSAPNASVVKVLTHKQPTSPSLLITIFCPALSKLPPCQFSAYWGLSSGILRWLQSYRNTETLSQEASMTSVGLNTLSDWIQTHNSHGAYHLRYYTSLVQDSGS